MELVDENKLKLSIEEKINLRARAIELATPFAHDAQDVIVKAKVILANLLDTKDWLPNSDHG